MQSDARVGDGCLKSRPRGQKLGDIQYIGRQLLMLSVKFALLSMAALLAFGFGLLASYVLLDFALLVYVIVFVLILEATMLVGLLALVFKRFDPSRTQPHDD
jgi:type IV secretory pathway TrbL component